MSVRLYGPIVGHGSYCRVASGMRHGLEALDQFAGLVPLDAYDEEAVYDGAEAEVGIYVGQQGGAGAMRQIGLHQERLVLLPPNSTYVPPDLLRYLEREATGLVTPSSWGAQILRGLTTLPVEIWQHGVDPGFCRKEADEDALDRDYDQGQFRVAHLASTAAQRKGTRELVVGWIQAVREGWVGVHPQLHLTVDGPPGVFRDDAALVASNVTATAGHDQRLLETIVWSRPRWNMSVAQAAHYYRKFHAVACPSRGEGFGMVPLESRACGVPVMGTSECTGHRDHMLINAEHALGEYLLAPGVIHVHTGELEPIDDGPGALAPSLRPQSIADALERAYHGWAGYAADARAHAKYLHERWSWPEVTKRWLESRRA